MLCHEAGEHTSRLHATLTWTGGIWHLRDSSLNGIWINGRRATQHHHALAKNDELRFGHPSADPWRIVDASPPRAFVLDIESRDQWVEQNNLIHLPDGRTVRVFSNHGYIRRGLQDVRLQQHDFVDVALGWRLYLAEGIETRPYLPRFSIDRVVIELGTEGSLSFVVLHENAASQSAHLEYRTYWSMLYELASARKADTSGEGWVDANDLTRKIGKQRNTLNQWINRTREMFDIHGVVGGKGIIQCARPNTRYRIGVPADRIILRS